MRARTILAWAAAALALSAVVAVSRALIPYASPPSSGASPAWRLCVEAVEGDFILLDGRERVRLLGVDCPEVDEGKPPERLGPEATVFTRELAVDRRVRLEYDGRRRDRFGRTLAYAFFEDGTLLNAEIIRQGFGVANPKYAHRRMREFRAIEREAKQARRGIWGLPDPPPAPRPAAR